MQFLYTVEYSIFITSDLAFSVVIFTNHVTLVSCKSDWITQCSGFMLQWPLFHLPFYWLARWHSYIYIHVSRGKIIILCYYYNNKTVHVHVFFFFFYIPTATVGIGKRGICSDRSDLNTCRPVQTDTTLLANNSQHSITIKICLCVLSAKMFENPDISGLLSLHQWKMPLH